MRLIMMVLFLAVLFMLGGCATGNQATGYASGVSETRIAEDSYLIQITGKPHTLSEMKRDYEFAVLRGAELTLDAGYSHFVVAGPDAHTEQSQGTLPQNVQSNYNAKVHFNPSSGSSNNGASRWQTQAMRQSQTADRPDRAIRIVMVADEQSSQSFDAARVAGAIRSKYRL